MSHARLFFGFSKADMDTRIAKAVSALSPRFQHEYGKEEAIGIADVREIQRRALLSAGDGTQCFIIQKADEMTREAHNAFLKILEEPPRGSYFFLIARSLVGIPETVQSRVEKISVKGQEEDNAAEAFGDTNTIRERDDILRFLENEIIRLKRELEENVRKGAFDKMALDKISFSIRLTNLLHTSRTSPRYIMDMYLLGTPRSHE